MSSNKTSQISLEFIILISFLFIICVGFITVSAYQMQEFSDEQNRYIINQFGNSIKMEINLASVVKDGYERTIILPDKIEGSINYTITTGSSTLTISAADNQFVKVIPNINGQLQKGKNTIRKINNTVRIENA